MIESINKIKTKKRRLNNILYYNIILILMIWVLYNHQISSSTIPLNRDTNHNSLQIETALILSISSAIRKYLHRNVFYLLTLPIPTHICATSNILQFPTSIKCLSLSKGVRCDRWLMLFVETEMVQGSFRVSLYCLLSIDDFD